MRIDGYNTVIDINDPLECPICGGKDLIYRLPKLDLNGFPSPRNTLAMFQCRSCKADRLQLRITVSSVSTFVGWYWGNDEGEVKP